MSWAARLLELLVRPFRHRHRWRDTRLNPWCIATEQRCRCGAMRHHLFEDFRWDGGHVWRDGPFPGSGQ